MVGYGADMERISKGNARSAGRGNGHICCIFSTLPSSNRLLLHALLFFSFLKDFFDAAFVYCLAWPSCWLSRLLAFEPR